MIRIGDFARLARISVRALRHYEAEGLLKPAHVDQRSRYRYYDLQQLEALERLLLLKELGFPLRAARELLGVEAREFRAALVRHQVTLERQLREQERVLAQVAALRTWLEEEPKSAGTMPGMVIRTKSYPALRALTTRASVAPSSNAITDMFEETERRARRARAESSPILLIHSGPRQTARLDVEVCVPVTRSCRLEAVRDIEPEPLSASVTYRGPYAEPASLYRRMRHWLGQQRLTLASRPIREIYHRFGADEVGYRLPRHRLAETPQRFVTELAIPIEQELA
jgi:DNA-binding transcriptional MerR regulator